MFTAWALLTKGGARDRVLDLGFNFSLNPILIGVCGHLVLFVTGWLASRLVGGSRPPDVERLLGVLERLPRFVIPVFP